MYLPILRATNIIGAILVNLLGLICWYWIGRVNATYLSIEMPTCNRDQAICIFIGGSLKSTLVAGFEILPIIVVPPSLNVIISEFVELQFI